MKCCRRSPERSFVFNNTIRDETLKIMKKCGSNFSYIICTRFINYYKELKKIRHILLQFLQFGKKKILSMRGTLKSINQVNDHFLHQ